jgi:hypothetical protein
VYIAVEYNLLNLELLGVVLMNLIILADQPGKNPKKYSQLHCDIQTGRHCFIFGLFPPGCHRLVWSYFSFAMKSARLCPKKKKQNWETSCC